MTKSAFKVTIKSAFKVTITATGTRMVGDQIGAEEHIKSTFIAHGEDVLVASNGLLAAFTLHYKELLDDIYIDSFHVTPHKED